jgi:hypothetical protein
MITDNALANGKVPWNLRGGDTGMRRAEHRGFLLMFTHHERTGQR